MDSYLQEHSVDGRVHLLVINSGYEEMLMNFVTHYNRVHKGAPPPIAVLTLDDEATVRLKERGIDAFRFTSKHWKAPQRKASSYGTATWGPIVMSKLAAIHAVVCSGYTVLYTDVDIVLHRPTQEIYNALKTQAGGELVFQQDGTAFHSVCTGVILATPTPFCKTVLCTDGVDAFRWQDDQMYIQLKLSQLKSNVRQKIVRLPLAQFPHGHFWKTSRNKCTCPVLVHYNYVVGKEAKIAWMKRDGVWKVT